MSVPKELPATLNSRTMLLPNAFVTLLTTPSYLPGALVLLHSLYDLHPEPRDFKIVCLVTPETVDARTIGELRKAGFDFVIGVEPIGSGRPGTPALDLLGRPELKFALTKLHIFRLHTLFSTLIYLDADVLPIRRLSHLFTSTSPHTISACPDTGWPDCFNSGVMVIRPRESDWVGLRKLLENGEGEEGIYEGGGNGSFDGADQGLLNEWFSEEGGGGAWNRLPFLYNVTPTAAYQYEPAYRRYGHKINAVHFIGPNKPWSNLAGRPAGMSQTDGNDAKFDYPSLIDRWYAGYDRYIRPTSAHAPDLARRFAVPETVAAWNQAGTVTGVPQQPDDRLDLSELKSAAERGVTSLKSGQYISLPLDGRVDLMMSRPKPKAISLPPRHASPTAISPPALNAPSPQTFQQQMTQPATWDGSRSAPPPTSGPEMLTPMTQRYAAAWDQPASAQSKYYSSQQTEPEYPNVPENVRGNDWYRGFAGSTPDRNNVLPVFPWEETPQHRRPDRVFPQGASSPSQNRSTGPSPQRNAEAKSMQETIASYTNAWDQMPSIRQYVMRITGTGQHSSERDLAVMGLQSVPETPRFESSMGRELSADRQSNISGDGDDEDDDEEGTVETETSPSVGHSRDSTFELPLDLPANARHRARQAQLARIPPPEAGLNIRNTPVVIGEVPKPERKVIARQSSSSDTPRTTPNLVTPPSDSARISGQAQYTSDSPEPRTSRIWDPSTDVDVRKRDTQNVLSRFMKVGGMPGGSGGK